MAEDKPQPRGHNLFKWRKKGKKGGVAGELPSPKNNDSCHECSVAFGVMKRKYHCRYCGESVCSEHSAQKAPFPEYGFERPQRICDGCANLLRDGGNGSDQEEEEQSESSSQKAQPLPFKFAKVCAVCPEGKAPFDKTMKRRHHCRKCGDSVCKDHSGNKIQLYGFKKLHAVCDPCYAILQVEGAEKKTMHPPAFEMLEQCHVCDEMAPVFSLTKRRHHCRNCGHSVCRFHSKGKAKLPQFGILEPAKVCDECWHNLNFVEPEDRNNSDDELVDAKAEEKEVGEGSEDDDFDEDLYSASSRDLGTTVMEPPPFAEEMMCFYCDDMMSRPFSTTHRRHHCRNCGNSVCRTHSKNRAPLPHIGLGVERVCDECYDAYLESTNPVEFLSRLDSNESSDGEVY